MKTTTTKPHKAGLLVHADDLAVGKYYAVHSIKNTADTHPVFAQAFQIKAMNLPFLVGEIVSDPARPVTFDVRYLNFMRVTPEYVEAQKGHVPDPN